MKILQSRRSNDKVSLMPSFMTILLTLLISALTYKLFGSPVPTDNKEVLLFLLGVVTAVWKDYASFWVQDTRSSQEKTKMLANSMPANSRRDDDPDQS